MTQKKIVKRPRRRVTQMKQVNPMAPPPSCIEICQRRPAIVESHKVGKSGAVHISKLPRGARVNVAQIDGTTFLVSSLPEEDVKQIASQLSEQTPSSFSALSEHFRGTKHDLPVVRYRHAYAGVSRVEAISDDHALAGADLQRARRAPR